MYSYEYMKTKPQINVWQRQRIKAGWKSFNAIRPVELIEKLKAYDKKIYTEWKLEIANKKVEELNNQ